MLDVVKRVVLRECWLHIWFRSNVTGRSCWLRSTRGSSWPLIINATPHRCASLFEVGDLSTEKGEADVGGRQVLGQTGEPRFAGSFICRDYFGLQVVGRC